MTREELIYRLEKMLEWYDPFEIDEEACIEAAQILKQELKTWQFVEWVAREIFDEMWEYNKDAFAEIACRKLEKLGIVRAKGDEWELVES